MNIATCADHKLDRPRVPSLEVREQLLETGIVP